MNHDELINKLKTADEQELRDLAIPYPHTEQELNDIVRAVTERTHDYGTCVYAMSIAAMAAFNFVGSKLGVTGFQASCADLDFLRRSCGIKGPFGIYDGHDLLYPQYDIEAKVRQNLAEWKPWAKEEARKLLAENETAHPDVIAHWKALAE